MTSLYWISCLIRFGTAVGQLLGMLANRIRFDVPWSALKPEFLELHALSSHRQSPQEELDFLGLPLTVTRIESHLSLCSACGHTQYHDHSPTISVRCDESQVLSTSSSSVDVTAEVALENHPSVFTEAVSPVNPPLSSPDNSVPVNSTVGFTPFYAPTIEVADLALALAQKAGVGSQPEDLPAHMEDC